MLKKTGIERDIFGLNAGKEPKEKDKKEKGNIKERPMSAALSVTQEAETPSVPLTTEAGDPVVVLIELELYTPLIQCRAKIDFTNALEEMITTTKVHDPYPYTIQLAEEQYLNSIRKLVDTITEGYRDFIEKNNTSQNQVDGSVMESCNETEIENSSSSKIFSEKSKRRIIAIYTISLRDRFVRCHSKYIEKENDLFVRSKIQVKNAHIAFQRGSRFHCNGLYIFDRANALGDK
ncbi:uncharacterized protein LOC112493792 isoform X4 [Cephus cinctus]|uniref:Uncharacterized protein LOC112493792 isoform X4 n=1 Tax=Cephus cinctus TaxID=211228 RepID=A0AAJ7RAC5_CEPCN|nr:uncharacterized protein LOC112493792 isoform X4 [Cephus cinctus]